MENQHRSTHQDSHRRNMDKLNAGTPPVRYGEPHAGPRVRYNESASYGQMNRSRTRNRDIFVGAAILGGLIAGGVALYNNSKENKSTSNSTGSKSLLGWLPNGEPITIRKRRTIRAKPSQVYAEWRKFENLPNILSHLKEVNTLSGDKSHWVAKGPANMDVEWDAVMTEDEPGRAIAWKSTSEAEVPNSGRVSFSEKPNGDTLLEVRLTYQPPAGDLGAAVAAAFGENPAKQIEDDLDNFKFALEERVTTKIK